MSGATDIAVVGYAQTPSVRRAADSEVQMLVPVVAAALRRAGVDRREIGFTCAGSCDYLTGGPFAFVSNLEAAGAWPAETLGKEIPVGSDIPINHVIVVNSIRINDASSAISRLSTRAARISSC